LFVVAFGTLVVPVACTRVSCASGIIVFDSAGTV